MAFLKIVRRLSVFAIGLAGAGNAGLLMAPATAQPLPSAFYDACILHPIRLSGGQYRVKSVDGIKYGDIFFPANNGKMLHGWLFEQPRATKTVLLSHGIGGNISSRLDLIHIFLQAGVSVFIYDYQGYGRSEGTASLRHVIDDGEAAYRYLLSDRGLKPGQIILAGESLGTGVACGLSRRVSASGLILQSPFSSLSRRCAEVVPLFRWHPHLLQPTSGLENDLVLREQHPPLLIVHGDQDRTVPVSHAFNLFAQACGKKELLVVNGAGHTGDPALMASPKYLLAVRNFLKELETSPSVAINHSSLLRPAALSY